MNISKLKFAGRQRLRESIKQCREAKKAVTVKSLSLKDKNDNRFLTNVSQIPLLDSTGEFQGIIMVIDDVTSVVAMQAELQRKGEEMDSLNRRFQETYTKLKLASIERNQVSRFASEIQREPVKEVVKPDERRFIAGDVEKQRRDEAEQEEGVTWKGDLRIAKEIDESLDVTDGPLKTKKLKDEESE
jgi:hypothetical protein